MAVLLPSFLQKFLKAPTSTRNRVFRNVTLKTMADVFPRGLTFLIIVVTARLLGSSDFGLFSYALAIAGILIVATDFGWNTVIVRRLASGDSSPVVSAVFRLKAACAMILLATQIVAGFFVPLRVPFWILSMLLITTLTYSFQDTMGAISSGKERFELEIVVKVIPRLVLLVGFSLFFFIPATLESVTLLFMTGNALGFAISLQWFLRHVPEWKRPAGGAEIKALIREALPFGIIGTLWIVYARQDMIILGHMNIAGDDLGYYATASKVLEIGRLAPVIVQMSLIPIFSSFASEPVRVFRYTLKMMSLMVPGAIALTAAFYWGARPLIELLFGLSFSPAYRPLQVGGAAMGLSLLHVPVAAALIALRLEGKFVVTSILAILLNLAINVALIPKLSYVAPAWALLATEALWLIVNFAILWNGVHRLGRQRAHLPGH